MYKLTSYGNTYEYISGLTGLEPATSAVTGRCSNQLNYNPFVFSKMILVMCHFSKRKVS